MATSGQKELKTNWPIEEGLGVNEKHDGQEDNLIADEDYTQHWGSI